MSQPSLKISASIHLLQLQQRHQVRLPLSREDPGQPDRPVPCQLRQTPPSQSPAGLLLQPRQLQIPGGSAALSPLGCPLHGRRQRLHPGSYPAGLPQEQHLQALEALRSLRNSQCQSRVQSTGRLRWQLQLLLQTHSPGYLAARMGRHLRRTKQA